MQGTQQLNSVQCREFLLITCHCCHLIVLYGIRLVFPMQFYKTLYYIFMQLWNSHSFDNTAMKTASCSHYERYIGVFTPSLKLKLL